MSDTLSQRVNDITNKLRRSVAFANVEETEQNIAALLDELGLNGQGNNNQQQSGSQGSQGDQKQDQQEQQQQGNQGQGQQDQQKQDQSGQQNGQSGSQGSQGDQNQDQSGQQNGQSGSQGGQENNQGEQKQDNFDNESTQSTSGQQSAIQDVQRGVSMTKAGVQASSMKGVSNGIDTISQALQDYKDNGGDENVSNGIQQGLEQIKQGLTNKSKKQINQGIDMVNSAVGDFKQQNMSSEGEDTSGFNSDISDSEKEGEQDDVSPDVDDPSKRMQKSKVTLNGITKEFEMISDITSKNDLKTPQGREKSEQDSKTQLADIDVAIQKAEKQIGESLSKQAGQGGSLASRNINAVLGAEITDWTTLLKNMLNKNRRKMYTRNSPVKSRLQTRLLPGQKSIGEFSEVEDIKICIDVSGSVTQKELDFFLSDIASIFNHYKVDGELIYWSTKIGDAGRFHDIQGLTKVQPNSTGGTDVKCVFDYLSGNVKLNDKRELTPIKGQSVFILTDGCFSKNYGEYERAYKGKTYWLIYDNQDFEPLFGKVYAYKKRSN